MPMRSILLGCLGGSFLVAGCFEEAQPTPEVGSSSDSSEGAPTATSTNPTATGTLPTATTGTDSSTTIAMTTIGTLDSGTDTATTLMTATETSESSGTTDPCDASCSGLACGEQMECDCGMCNPMAMCADDQTYCGLPIGFFNVFADQTQVLGEVQLGFRFEVFEPRTVRRLGVIAGGAGAEVRMALYGHDGSGPSNRIVQTGMVMLFAAGNNEFDVGATEIMPGEYWVMLHTNGPAPLRRTPNGDNNYESAVRGGIPFGDGFPMNMDDEMILTDYRYNLYMVVED